MMLVNERLVEIPWALERCTTFTLDVGGAEGTYIPDLPEYTILLDIRPIVVPLPDTFDFVQSSVVQMPFEDDSFDTVLCLSTYEHFGLAHEPYGTIAEEGVAQQGLREMWRVLKPGGSLLLTLPFGKSQTHSWLRQFSYDDLREEFSSIWSSLTEETYFRYSPLLQGYYAVPATECTEEEYDMYWKRAHAVACLVFTKESE